MKLNRIFATIMITCLLAVFMIVGTLVLTNQHYTTAYQAQNTSVKTPITNKK